MVQSSQQTMSYLLCIQKVSLEGYIKCDWLFKFRLGYNLFLMVASIHEIFVVIVNKSTT